jgi:SAM-dependent methyltransferase
MSSETPPNYFGRDLEAMSFASNYHKWILDEITPFLGENLAEVGAGTGNFTDLLLKSHGGNLVCFEPSSNMFPILSRRFKDHARVTVIQDYFGNRALDYAEKLDSIIYINVLEHIEDDHNELTHAHACLKNQGTLVIFVPALSWLYSPLDESVGHFRRYHKSTLVNLVDATGFKIEQVRYFDLVGILPWYVAFVLLKRGITGRDVNSYDKLVVPIVRRLEALIAPPIGKNLLLVARKSVE